MQTIKFNTGRLYTDKGQRVAAASAHMAYLDNARPPHRPWALNTRNQKR